MPDQIGDFRVLNKLQPPASFAWEIQRITREYVDGDAWQRVAKRAAITQHACVFLCATAVEAKTFVTALYAIQGTAGATMVADGQSYDEITIVRVAEVRTQPLQRRTRGVKYDGTNLNGGAGGRLVYATVVVGRSNAPPPPSP